MPFTIGVTPSAVTLTTRGAAIILGVVDLTGPPQSATISAAQMAVFEALLVLRLGIPPSLGITPSSRRRLNNRGNIIIIPLHFIYSWGSEALIASLVDVLYRGAPPDSNVDEELTRKRIAALWRRGHWSVFELMGFGLLVECSRACHIQFIRHRMASYWAESQRYVDYSRQELRLVVPRDFPVELLEEGIKAYMRLREAGQRPEWARLVLPNAVAVRFVAQMNAREFFTVFAPLRCSASAQAEIRHLLANVRRRLEALAHAGKAGLGRSADFTQGFLH